MMRSLSIIFACYGTATLTAALVEPGDQPVRSFVAGALIGLAAFLGQRNS